MGKQCFFSYVKSGLTVITENPSAAGIPHFTPFLIMSAAIDTFEVVEALSQAVNAKYAYLSAVVLLVYDTVLNSTDEIQLIWLQRWSVGKALYILSRYGCFADAALALFYGYSTSLSLEACRNVYKMGILLMAFGAMTCQVVLIFRTYAVWGRSMSILVYLCLIQVAAVIIFIFILNKFYLSIIFVPSPYPRFAPCVPVLGDSQSFVVFCTIMVVELNILCVLLIKGLSQWQRMSTPLVQTLYRDGVAYFAVLFLISLINVLYHSSCFSVVAEHQRVLHSILASRVIINIRKVWLIDEFTESTLSGKGGGVLRDRLTGDLSIEFASGVTEIHSEPEEEHTDEGRSMEFNYVYRRESCMA